MSRRQFVLDKKSNRTLNQLAGDGAGNFSSIVRRGIQLVAEQEAMFDAIESNPGFIAMMEQSDKDFQAGRYITLDELKKKLRANRRKAS